MREGPRGSTSACFGLGLGSPAPGPTPAFTFVERRSVGGVYAPEEDELPGDAVVMLG